MWTDGRRTKTNPKTLPEQSVECWITRETAPHPWWPCFLTDRDHLQTHLRYIYKTNLFTKFHDDWANKVTSRPCYSTDRNHFRTQLLYQGNNVLTKFHENWAKNVTSRVFTCFYYIHIEKNAPPTGVHVFSPIWTLFNLVRDSNKTNVLTNFHDDWAKKKKTAPPTGGHFTCFHYIHIEKNAPPTGVHVFSPIWTIFELVLVINKTNVLTKFHDDWAKIVTSRVFTRKTAPPTGGHAFHRTGTTFELNQHIIKANILTNFELDRDIIWTNFLTKFHEDQTINVVSGVFTNKCGRTTDKDRSQKLT
ncbi:hypothetical protein DPMN_164000 [Dreissena polymorpha]|uniref:Uncharacterized protein n=1 Tax=Dreissena polymorpha TaxID=45954 RepID=A0A9D4ES62_DREPO|nr:hypothetical protein DPMN_164000 [Dreissena polymorpha]